MSATRVERTRASVGLTGVRRRSFGVRCRGRSEGASEGRKERRGRGAKRARGLRGKNDGVAKFDVVEGALNGLQSEKRDHSVLDEDGIGWVPNEPVTD